MPAYGTVRCFFEPGSYSSIVDYSCFVPTRKLDPRTASKQGEPGPRGLVNRSRALGLPDSTRLLVVLKRSSHPVGVLFCLMLQAPYVSRSDRYGMYVDDAQNARRENEEEQGHHSLFPDKVKSSSPKLLLPYLFISLVRTRTHQDYAIYTPGDRTCLPEKSWAISFRAPPDSSGSCGGHETNTQ